MRARLAAGEVVDDDFEMWGEPRRDTMVSRRVAGLLAVAKPVTLTVGIAVASLGTIKTVVLTWRAVAGVPHDLRSPDMVDEQVDDAHRPGARASDAAPVMQALAPTAPTLMPPPKVMRVVPPGEPPGAAAPPSGPVRPLAPPTINAKTQSGSPRAPLLAPIDDRLRRETLLMLRAKQQLSKRQWEPLLVTLAEHAAQFPQGPMTPERLAWAAIARCSLEDARGPVAGKSFVAGHPRSTLVDTVRRACGLSKKSDGRSQNR
ncbi:MAG: hypothetical protein JKY37_34990 [Nannocystaceae bacterium]|nr:hypothetical protein [Nannocystaceae bacterium]